MVKVSVIIPTYGKPIFLEKAIKSVLDQTLDDTELIIVDDNNPDTEARKLTEAIIREFRNYEHKITYIKHDCNKNGAVARNTGFSVAQGKYISLLDSDDEYMLERLLKCYLVMERAPENIAGVYTGCEFRRSGRTYHVERRILPGNHLVKTLACNFVFCTGSNLFVRKSVIDNLNGFDGDFFRHQDYEFLVRVFEKFSLEAIPEVLVIKNNENINLPSIDKQIVIKKQYLTKYKYIIDALPIADQNYIFHSQAVEIAENALRTGNKDIAKLYYKKAGEYENLTFQELFRKIAFLINNIVH